jgi:hypothetical protein|tara:strand:+ start:4789 stop:5517 length:729 start_codon:yes stop_codon:yes gene_type:complete
MLGGHSGNEGDDWKWRKVGRLKDGVDGMTSRAGLLSVLPGVDIVKLRFDGRLFGGVGGLMNSGDGGAELFFSRGITATGACVWPRRLVSEVVVLIPRFFKFRAFFAGVVGRCNSKKAPGDESPELVSGLRDLKSATNEEAAAVLANGDSGEGPGDGSVTDDESMVEMVVVGELSEEVVELLSRLSVCMWKEEKVPFTVAPLEAGRPTLLSCASGVSWGPLLCSSPPNTEPNEGIGMKDRALV